MSGRRLTQQERQRIARGLAEDLPYAEIARGLDRPTSTITREVMRNGGPNGYRADLAHLATERRVRRPKRTAPPRRGAPAPGFGRDDAAVHEYEETFTALLMQQGMPTMTARVMTCLLIADTGSVTAAELVQRLAVSPATVSKAIAGLEGQGLIRREREDRRRERYFVDGDVWYESTIESARGMLRLAEVARQGVTVLGRETPAGGRLENMARFGDHIGESIIRAADQVRELLHSQPPAGSEDDAAG
ncbi:MarR family transcriptional regulator [Phytomonospora endophytica]|uniref:DNA-binding transcriptional ArsR family regulator n=1 Tax=Phytomonospora endophytica TaxID=714109 RepID=A0A841FPH8_9ACTN|nr:helix-turn-helix domain-containing protein [Phytomonospora endophytica]MBB6036753.1 DNA-binding transcriptional ArsR family regulator [Phytomonospora endophytica]GIG68213.1 MarR family transcriptional regulator [Phytomonospora endophytica]